MLVKFCAGFLKYFYLHESAYSKSKIPLIVSIFMELISISVKIMQKNWK